jgi:hypothetical protein
MASIIECSSPVAPSEIVLQLPSGCLELHILLLRSDVTFQFYVMSRSTFPRSAVSMKFMHSPPREKPANAMTERRQPWVGTCQAGETVCGPLSAFESILLVCKSPKTARCVSFLSTWESELVSNWQNDIIPGTSTYALFKPFEYSRGKPPRQRSVADHHIKEGESKAMVDLTKGTKDHFSSV